MLKMFQKIEGIPWYRRRWFWLILLSPLFSFSILFYSEEFFPPKVFKFFFFDLAIATYGFPITTIVAGIFDDSWLGKSIGGLIHISLYSFLVFKIFRYARVKFRYPILFILLVLFGFAVGLPI